MQNTLDLGARTGHKNKLVFEIAPSHSFSDFTVFDAVLGRCGIDPLCRSVEVRFEFEILLEVLAAVHRRKLGEIIVTLNRTFEALQKVH